MDPKTKSFRIIELILGAALVAAVLYFYWPVLAYLLNMIIKDDDFSFIIILPVISGYVTYLKWEEIKNKMWQPSWWGLATITLGYFLYVIGELFTSFYIPTSSFVVVIAGIILLIGGWPLIKLLCFPILCLLLMIPFMGPIIIKISLPLQLLSSYFATLFYHIIGISAVRDGNIIDLGINQLQVVGACSGLRYILPLISLGIVFCYFYQRCFWKAIFIISTIIPVAIILNAIRIFAMGIYPAVQKGFWHSFSGWIIFILCFGSLTLINSFLNYLWEQPLKSDSNNFTLKIGELSPSNQISHTPYLITALLLVLIISPIAKWSAEVPAVPITLKLIDFPMKISSWQGIQQPIDPAIVNILQTNDQLNADYTNPGSPPISLWIGYFENQKGIKSFHSPLSCFTSSGWQILETNSIEVSPGLSVASMLVDKENTRLLVFYWLFQRGRWLSGTYINKFQLAYDGLLKRRSDGAMIRLITPVDKNVETAQERLIAFIRLLIPELSKFIPD